MATSLRSSPVPSFMVDNELKIVVWSVGMAGVSSGVDPRPGTLVAELPYASNEARQSLLDFFRGKGDTSEGDANSTATCLMHMRPPSSPEECLFSIAIVTKTERGDLVVVGTKLDPRLAGLYGGPVLSEETISDITPVTYLPEGASVTEGAWAP